MVYVGDSQKPVRVPKQDRPIAGDSVEGGYTDDPSDHGGATNKGITQREYAEWLRLNHLPKRKVADILNVDVREIYWSEYWLAGRCDRMPWPLCLAHFDACVNVGVGQAAKFLQRALGCKDDGAIGPRMLAALRGALESGFANATAVLFRNFGQIEGVLAVLKCRVEYLKPNWWRKQLRLGKSADHGDRWKAHLKGRA